MPYGPYLGHGTSHVLSCPQVLPTAFYLGSLSIYLIKCALVYIKYKNETRFYLINLIGGKFLDALRLAAQSPLQFNTHPGIGAGPLRKQQPITVPVFAAGHSNAALLPDPFIHVCHNFLPVRLGQPLRRFHPIPRAAAPLLFAEWFFLWALRVAQYCRWNLRQWVLAAGPELESSFKLPEITSIHSTNSALLNALTAATDSPSAPMGLP